MNPNNIKIVLVEPQYAGNIGSCARAMKNMGLQKLVMVKPVDFMVDEGFKMAVDAKSILKKAEIYPNLKDALSGTSLSIGTTRRKGKLRKPIYSIKEVVQKACSLSEKEGVAFVFGREDKGLLTQELKLCTLLSTIPTDDRFPSINLAQSVMITCYELFFASGSALMEEQPALAKFEDVEDFFRHLEETLVRIDFLNETYPTSIMVALRRLFGKAQLEEREVKILRGILRQVHWYVNQGKSSRKK
jgi:tRNA/rRNA methyltransferase